MSKTQITALIEKQILEICQRYNWNSHQFSLFQREIGVKEKDWLNRSTDDFIARPSGPDTLTNYVLQKLRERLKLK